MSLRHVVFLSIVFKLLPQSPASFWESGVGMFFLGFLFVLKSGQKADFCGRYRASNCPVIHKPFISNPFLCYFFVSHLQEIFLSSAFISLMSFLVSLNLASFKASALRRNLILCSFILFCVVTFPSKTHLPRPCKKKLKLFLFPQLLGKQLLARGYKKDRTCEARSLVFGSLTERRMKRISLRTHRRGFGRHRLKSPGATGHPQFRIMFPSGLNRTRTDEVSFQADAIATLPPIQGNAAIKKPDPLPSQAFVFRFLKWWTWRELNPRAI